MTTVDERQLVTLAAGGDADAFGELVRRYRDMVYGYCYYRTGGFEDARDLCQEAFIRAYTHLGQLDHPERFGGWLRRIAANICTRWSERQKEIPLEKVEKPRQPDESPAASFVRDALRRLPETERLAVVMYYVDGLSYADIADFLDISRDAVRGRLYRGRETLKAEVLKMTREVFEENRPDEEQIIASVRTAVGEAERAQNVLKNKGLAREKVEKAAFLIETIGEKPVDDPKALADALLTVAARETCLEDSEQAQAHLEQARVILEELDDQNGLDRWRAGAAYARLMAGELQTARDLYAQVIQRRIPNPAVASVSDMRELGHIMAGLKALDSLDGDVRWDMVDNFQAGVAEVRWDDQDVIIYGGGDRFGKSGERYPEHLRKSSGPPRDPTRLPTVLMRLTPELGDTNLFRTWEGDYEVSVLESLTDAVATPAGTFNNCMRTISRISRSGWDADDIFARRTLWFAPGVGVVRIAYESLDDDHIDTSELADFHVTPTDVPHPHFPMKRGNWWLYRWAEGEEVYGYKTRFFREVAAEEAGGCVLIQHTVCIRQN